MHLLWFRSSGACATLSKMSAYEPSPDIRSRYTRFELVGSAVRTGMFVDDIWTAINFVLAETVNILSLADIND